MKQELVVSVQGRLNPGQRQVLSCSERWTAFLGGWGAGKTWIGARVALQLASINDGMDGLIVAPFWSTIYRTTLREFQKACPPRIIKRHFKKERLIELVNGSNVFYGSADRPETLDGATVAWQWIDEARYLRREAWRVCDSRLRFKGAKALRGIITSTPGGPFLEEEFAREKKGRAAVHVSTRENRRNLADGYIESLESSFSAREIKVFLGGQFGRLTGSVYESFDRRTHLIPWTYRPELRTAIALDFGYRRPALLWLQQIPRGTPIPPAEGETAWRVAHDNTWIVFDEMMPENTTTEQLARDAADKQYPVEVVSCDPAGDGTQPALGISDVEVMRANGFPNIRFVTEPSLRHVPNGVKFVSGLLRNARGETRLYVARHLGESKALRGIVKNLEGYAYPEAVDGRPVGDEPKKDGLHDHGCDALRYFVTNDMVSRNAVPSHVQLT